MILKHNRRDFYGAESDVQHSDEMYTPKLNLRLTGKHVNNGVVQ